jgi:hypothetical protein
LYYEFYFRATSDHKKNLLAQSARFLAHARYAKAPVADSLHGFKSVCQLPDTLQPASNRHDLQAVIVVQVDMLCRDNDLLVVVLKIRQSIHQLPPVVVVDVGDRPGRFPIFILLDHDELHPDEIPQDLGAVRVFLPPDHAVEALKQAFLEGYAEADDL